MKSSKPIQELKSSRYCKKLLRFHIFFTITFVFNFVNSEKTFFLYKRFKILKALLKLCQIMDEHD